MKIMLIGAMLLGASTVYAAKDCNELKDEIAAKIDAKGVANYSLEIIENSEEESGKVVGTCGGGTKKIVYNRGEQATIQAAPAEEALE